MAIGCQCIFIIFFALLANLAFSKDLPCAPRTTLYGHICVCNDTYCDTVEDPTPLQPGNYYHYMTSEASPGFTKSTGTFNNFSSVKEIVNNISNVYIYVNSTVQYQTFTGFGASFTDNSGGLILSALSPTGQQNFIESFFGITGIGYTFVRLPIAASDFSPKLYTYDDVPGDVDLIYFNLTDQDFKIKIPLIKMAMNVSKQGIKVIATPWTAPDWMKTNNETSAAYLRSEYLSVWTNYLKKFLEAYRTHGIEMWALSQGNEVVLGLFFGSFFPLQNTIWLPDQVRYWTKTYLGPMLKESGFQNVKIFSLDDERPFINWWAKRLFADQEASQYIYGIALHWYFDSKSTLPMLDEFQNNYPSKVILYTESSINSFQSGGAAVNLGDWSRGVRYINNIFENLDHWVVGYIDWNIALNEEGGPTGPLNMTLDASVIINSTNGEFYKQPLFYVLGHFSKFFRPGSVKIQVTIKQNTSTTCDQYTLHEPIANKINNKIERMNLNYYSTTTPSPFPTSEPIPQSNIVQAMATSNPDGSYSIIAYNPRDEPANLIIKDSEKGSFNQIVEAHSLNSFIYW